MLKSLLGSALVAATLLSTQVASAVEFNVWNDLVYSTMRKGEAGKFQEYATFVFKQGTSFDITQERSVEYFTIAARVTLDGTPIPLQASTVQETWVRFNDGWQITQLLRTMGMDGKMTKVQQSVIILDAENIVKKSDVVPLDIQDPTQVEAYEQKLLQWSEFSKAIAN